MSNLALSVLVCALVVRYVISASVMELAYIGIVLWKVILLLLLLIPPGMGVIFMEIRNLQTNERPLGLDLLCVMQEMDAPQWMIDMVVECYVWLIRMVRPELYMEIVQEMEDMAEDDEF